MQPTYIVLIVLMCLALIFIGGGYGIAKLLEIKTPSCPLKEYYNKTTDKCEPKCEWVSYTAELEANPRLVHLKDDYVITRWIDNDDNVVVTTTSIYNLKTLSDNIRNTLISYKRLEVLLAEPDLYEWKSWSNGTAIPYNAIEGGLNRNKIVYVCGFIFEFHFAGMMNRNNRTCSWDYSGVSNATYDLLVYKQ